MSKLSALCCFFLGGIAAICVGLGTGYIQTPPPKWSNPLAETFFFDSSVCNALSGGYDLIGFAEVQELNKLHTVKDGTFSGYSVHVIFATPEEIVEARMYDPLSPTTLKGSWENERNVFSLEPLGMGSIIAVCKARLEDKISIISIDAHPWISGLAG